MIQKALFLFPLIWVCTDGQWCSSTEKRCNDGRCVNTLVNCPEDCPQANYKNCKDGTCVESWLECVDEGCDFKKPFKCKSENKCFSKSQECDKVNHCRDGSDELDCSSKVCEDVSQKKCQDGSCINWSHSCPEKCRDMDRIKYCNAGGCVYTFSDCIDEGCNARKPFKCTTTAECYADYDRCDDEINCSDGSDEMDCDAYHKEKETIRTDRGGASGAMTAAIIAIPLVVVILVVVVCTFIMLKCKRGSGGRSNATPMYPVQAKTTQPGVQGAAPMQPVQSGVIPQPTAPPPEYPGTTYFPPGYNSAGGFPERNNTQPPQYV